MTIRTYKTSSVEHFVERLDAVLGTGREPVWFRGHSNEKWPLLPGYQRYKRPPPESVLINRFRQNANLLVTNRLDNDFDWLFVMQHYGVPTRLLDWTESPLASLYFATLGHPKADADVWALFPLKLNHHASKRPKDAKYVPSFNDTEIVGNYSTLSIETTPLEDINPLAVMATRNNSRIQAQLGVFTISHLSKIPLETIGNKNHLLRFKIPASAKLQIRKQLRRLAVSKFTLFPELSSIGDIMREDL